MENIVNGVDVAQAFTHIRDFLPNVAQSQVAVQAPGATAGYWVGASSAIEFQDNVYIAYRERVPVELGRGQGVTVGRSSQGDMFAPLVTIDKASMDAESLERPALVRTLEGKWRLYLSCATTGTKHWRVEMLEADDPSQFDASTRRVVMPGDAHFGVKDPVIQYRDGVWHAWVTFHPLDVPGQEDRMYSRYATSADGIDWQWAGGAALMPRAGYWDSRGARITAVHFMPNFVMAFYDGRASAQENYEERTGIAVGVTPDRLGAIGNQPFAQSPNGMGLRYVDIVPLSGGDYRLYYELTKPDASHELRTQRIIV